MRPEAARALALVDLTSLGEDDDEATVAALLERAVTPAGPVAAVCLWPALRRPGARGARRHAGPRRDGRQLPAGRPRPGRRGRAGRGVAGRGADEIDVVFPFERLPRGEVDTALAFVRSLRAATGGATLKVILETGRLADPDVIRCRGRRRAVRGRRLREDLDRQALAGRDTGGRAGDAGGDPRRRPRRLQGVGRREDDRRRRGSTWRSPTSCSAPSWATPGHLPDRRQRAARRPARRSEHALRSSSAASATARRSSATRSTRWSAASPTATSPTPRSARWPWRSSSTGSRGRARRADARDARLGRRARLERARPAGARQALHRRRGRQGQPAPRPARGRLRRRGADDLRPRARPHRRHAGQARRDPRLRHPARARAADRRGPGGRLRDHRPDRTSSRRPTAACTPSATPPARSSPTG